MDSSENSVRRLAEDRLIKILLETRYDPARCRGTRIEFAYEHLHDELLSLLSEAMEENTKQGSARIIFDQGESKGRREGRAAAFNEAAEIALHCWDHVPQEEEFEPSGYLTQKEIADKLRRKAGGGE